MRAAVPVQKAIVGAQMEMAMWSAMAAIVLFLIVALAAHFEGKL